MLTYTSFGVLEFAKGCLSIPGAGANAAVGLVACDATKQTQLWIVTSRTDGRVAARARGVNWAW